MKIDIEPTWEQILNLCEARADNTFRELLENLRPACHISDSIRQAQKKGSKKIVITFDEKGSAVIDDGLPEEVGFTLEELDEEKGHKERAERKRRELENRT